MNKIKKIISVFLKAQPDLINESTIIDRTAIQGSILVHRMYAEIEKAGYKIEDYGNIHTFGELVKKFNSDVNPDQVKRKQEISDNFALANTHKNQKIGIDIESQQWKTLF